MYYRPRPITQKVHYNSKGQKVITTRRQPRDDPLLVRLARLEKHRGQYLSYYQQKQLRDLKRQIYDESKQWEKTKPWIPTMHPVYVDVPKITPNWKYTPKWQPAFTVTKPTWSPKPGRPVTPDIPRPKPPTTTPKPRHNYKPRRDTNRKTNWKYIPERCYPARMLPARCVPGHWIAYNKPKCDCESHYRRI